MQRYDFFSYEQHLETFFCHLDVFHAYFLGSKVFFRTFAVRFRKGEKDKKQYRRLLKSHKSMDRRLNDILELEESQIGLMNLIAIERLMEKHPYSSLLYAFAAKFAKVLGNQNSDKYLLQAAAYCFDRGGLKTFMEKPLKKHDQKPLSQTQTATPPPQKEEKQDNILDEINSYTEPGLSETPTKEEVIERFLKIENPKVGKVVSEQEDYAIDRIIKQSASDDFKIVTETMAKLYLKQGNKDKALQIYRQLSALNPKKSAYFADRIKELEENK